MHLSRQQYQNLMQMYDLAKQRNRAIELNRKNKVHEQIPEIAQIDAEIAHRKITSAKYRIFHPDASEELKEISDIRSLCQEKAALLQEGGFPADYLDPIYSCPHCQDSGYQGKEKCSCFLDKIRALYLEESNLKNTVFQDNFQHFNTNFYSREIPAGKKMSPYDNIQHVLQISQHFIEDFSPDRSQNLLVYGNTGVGKTFLTRCIGAELLSKTRQVLYLTAYQLFEQLADYTFHRENYEGNDPHAIFDTELLIIDDLGAEMSNSFTNSQLFLCINERLLHRKSTIISTNFSLKELSANYTERVSSRIIESYELLNIFGEDIRIKKALGR